MNEILKKEIVFSTPWFKIESKTVSQHESPFYALTLLDYVTIIALTIDSEILLVKQFRPIIEEETLELPSGHVEKAETPECAAKRELLEETGYEVGKIELLGVLNPDVGRLENKLWCFFTSDVKKRNDVTVEESITLLKCKQQDLFGFINNGQFKNALNISAILLSVLNKKIDLNQVIKNQNVFR